MQDGGGEGHHRLVPVLVCIILQAVCFLSEGSTMTQAFSFVCNQLATAHIV